ncbi:MAG: enoyl-CoA hydratase/isomerase family protein [Chloroflexi bacterium]|nr:enoyl-CoA hydratase/isomerase family protein [Chloroflexota bacterium]
MPYQDIKVEQKGHIGTIRLNRPDKLNAVSGLMRDEMAVALKELHASGARVIVITGEGRGFCAGVDVTTMGQRGQQTEEEAKLAEVRRQVQPLPGAWALGVRNIPVPTIAAVNGVAVGMGLSIALASDIRIAAESARFSSIFIKRGIVPDNGACWLLPRIVGVSKAFEMMYTARMVGAQEALAIGLVSRVVPDAELMSAAMELAQEIAKGPPIALSLTKRAVWRGLEDTLENIAMAEERDNDRLRITEDRAEGFRSFLEKREPVFKGR